MGTDSLGLGGRDRSGRLKKVEFWPGGDVQIKRRTFFGTIAGALVMAGLAARLESAPAPPKHLSAALIDANSTANSADVTRMLITNHTTSPISVTIHCDASSAKDSARQLCEALK